MDKFGAVHILVNSAGIGTIARIIGKKGPMDVNILKKTIDVNLIGTFNCMSNLAWEMSKNDTVENGERGVIINVASIAGFEGQIGQIAYAASKAGIIGMTITAARDLSSHGIRCVPLPRYFLNSDDWIAVREFANLWATGTLSPRLGRYQSLPL